MTASQGLVSLRWNWGEAYDIAFTGSTYTAKRRDNGRLLSASSTGALHDKIVADYARQPVPREMCLNQPEP